MRSLKLSPISNTYSDELEILVKRDYVYFNIEIDQVGNSFRVHKKDLLKLIGGIK